MSVALDCAPSGQRTSKLGDLSRNVIYSISETTRPITCILSLSNGSYQLFSVDLQQFVHTKAMNVVLLMINSEGEFTTMESSL